MADQLNARMYGKQVERFRRNASNEADSVHQRIESIRRDLANGGKVTIALGAAKNMARDVAELIAALSAVAVLEDMQFVVEDQEASDG